jgi:hypothetical protein
MDLLPVGAMDETGPWYGTVTVQNLDDEPIVISAHAMASD